MQPVRNNLKMVRKTKAQHQAENLRYAHNLLEYDAIAPPLVTVMMWTKSLHFEVMTATSTSGKGGIS